MPHTSNVIYQYDGSFEGMLCCVYESVYNHEVPLSIRPIDETEPTLFEQRFISTDEERAARVYDSIPRKMGWEAAELVQCTFLSCAKEREMMILLFLLAGYRQGMQIMHMVSNPAVKPLLAAQLSLKNEAHLLLGFVRFSDYNGALVATITPKNFVLPFLREHFCERYPNENFLIYDRTHRAALLWQNRQARILSLEALEVPPAGAEELRYRAMWKRFYDTVAIAARENPRCRMTHMPKRYWENLCELTDALPEAPTAEKLSAPAGQSMAHAAPLPPHPAGDVRAG